ncbi:methionine adenosyltransferase [Bradyrhizobium yuanmingense]|uniref:methionine adenosyltransferase n=1 Tax=Bradyrhizobium yuanmingense TaxID=108015 RepID=UPI0030B87744
MRPPYFVLNQCFRTSWIRCSPVISAWVTSGSRRTRNWSAEVSEANCLIVSNIGAPISEPVLVEAKLAQRRGVALEQLRSRTEEVVASHLTKLPEVLAGLASARAQLF